MRIAVLGCGYVGPELARTLAADGHDVWGARRFNDGSDAIKAISAEAVHAGVTSVDSLGTVPGVGHIVFAASSSSRGADAVRAVFIESLRTTADQFAAHGPPPERLVCASNTGIYGDHSGDFVDESTPFDPTTDKVHTLTEAEHVAREYTTERGVEETVTRFAGSCGPDRYRLEHCLNGPTTAGRPDMIRRDGATGVVALLLETDHARNDTVLVVNDELVSRYELTS